MEITRLTPRSHSQYPKTNPKVSSDACTFNLGTTLDLRQIGKAAYYGGTSLLPGVGTYHNLVGAIGSGFNSGPASVRMSGAGAMANVAGTILTTVGLITGRTNMVKVGAGLLGVSGLTAAYVYGTSA